MEKAKVLQNVIGTEQFDDFNQFDEVLKSPQANRHQAGCQREETAVRCHYLEESGSRTGD